MNAQPSFPKQSPTSERGPLTPVPWRVTVIVLLPVTFTVAFQRLATQTGTDHGSLLERFLDWGLERHLAQNTSRIGISSGRGALVARVSHEHVLALAQLRNADRRPALDTYPAIFTFDPWLAMAGLGEALTGYFVWGWHAFEQDFTGRLLSEVTELAPSQMGERAA